MERNLMVAGFGGQGVMTLGKFLAEAACDSTDKNVTFFPSYGAEQRGGTANCYVVISDDDIGAPLGDHMDDLIVMNDPSLSKFLYKLVPGGTLFINSSIVKSAVSREDVKVVRVPVTEMARPPYREPWYRASRFSYCRAWLPWETRNASWPASTRTPSSAQQREIWLALRLKKLSIQCARASTAVARVNRSDRLAV